MSLFIQVFLKLQENEPEITLKLTTLFKIGNFSEVTQLKNWS